MNFNCYFTPLTKIHTQWLMVQHTKPRNLELLKENTGEYLHKYGKIKTKFF